MIAEMSRPNFQFILYLSKICPSVLLCVGGTGDKIKEIMEVHVNANFHIIHIILHSHTWHKDGTASSAHFSMMAATCGCDFSSSSIFAQ